MGILQSKKVKSTKSQGIDPFDSYEDPFLEKNLLADFGAARFKGDLFGSPESKQDGNIRRRLNFKRLLVIALFCGASGFVIARTKPWEYFARQEIVYAYFELRALDTSGRPLAGAIVKNGGKRVGTTDSFGEWRRYMKVPLGATVPVTLAKKLPNQLLVATKNFAVPPTKPEKSDIELRGSVQLQVADANDSFAKNAASMGSVDLARAGSGEVKESQAKDTMTPMDHVAQKMLQTSSEKQPDKTSAATSQAMLSEPVNFSSSHEAISFEVAGSTSSALSRDILPALKRRATELGLREGPNAEWKVRLTSLLDKPTRMDKEGGGLILISSFGGDGGSNVREFLRNYQSDPNLTARGILFILANHVNKNIAVQKVGERWAAMLPTSSSELWKLAAGRTLAGDSGIFTLSEDAYTDQKMQGYYLRLSTQDPCVKDVRGCQLKTRSFAEIPPVPTWGRLRLKTSSFSKEPVKIFVSGYEAKPIGDKVYEYWGQDKARANVTVVQSGRVLYRGQILSDANNAATLPLANISRR